MKKEDCSNYRDITLCQIHRTYKILSNVLLSRWTPYGEEITVDNQCGFRSYTSTADHIFWIRQTLNKKWEYNEAVHQFFVDFKKPYDSVRKENLYNILIEFGILRKLVRLIKLCLNEMYSRVRVGKYLSDMFPAKNYVKKGDVFSQLHFNFWFFAITFQLLVYLNPPLGGFR